MVSSGVFLPPHLPRRRVNSVNMLLRGLGLIENGAKAAKHADWLQIEAAVTGIGLTCLGKTGEGWGGRSWSGWQGFNPPHRSPF